MVCSAMELIGPGAGTPRTDTLLGATALADMLPSDPQSFKIPNAPAHDLQPLKLEPRLPPFNLPVHHLGGAWGWGGLGGQPH